MKAIVKKLTTFILVALIVFTGLQAAAYSPSAVTGLEIICFENEIDQNIITTTRTGTMNFSSGRIWATITANVTYDASTKRLISVNSSNLSNWNWTNIYTGVDGGRITGHSGLFQSIVFSGRTDARLASNGIWVLRTGSGSITLP